MEEFDIVEQMVFDMFVLSISKQFKTYKEEILVSLYEALEVDEYKVDLSVSCFLFRVC